MTIAWHRRSGIKRENGDSGEMGREKEEEEGSEVKVKGSGGGEEMAVGVSIWSSSCLDSDN